jgi:hypothetical protein
VYILNFSENDKERLTELHEFGRTSEGDWKLNEQRVNDAWFIWIIVNFYNKVGTLSITPIKSIYCKSSNMLNTEEMCEALWQEMCASRNMWVKHRCKTPGCQRDT